MKKLLPLLFCFVYLLGCASSSNGGAPQPQQQTFEGERVYSSNDPQVTQGPEFLQNKFKIYTIWKPQVQRRNFNGIFDIQPTGARIVRRYWNTKFIELTRENYYEEFFIEFYDYMNLLVSYPMPNRQKELMMDSLEKSFHLLCEGKDIGEEYRKFQEAQRRIYGVPG